MRLQMGIRLKAFWGRIRQVQNLLASWENDKPLPESNLVGVIGVSSSWLSFDNCCKFAS